jgi:hypothetical protein
MGGGILERKRDAFRNLVEKPEEKDCSLDVPLNGNNIKVNFKGM